MSDLATGLNLLETMISNCNIWKNNKPVNEKIADQEDVATFRIHRGKVGHNIHTFNKSFLARANIIERFLSTIKNLPEVTFYVSMHDDIPEAYNGYQVFGLSRKVGQSSPLIHNIDVYSGFLKNLIHNVYPYPRRNESLLDQSLFVGQATGKGDRTRYVELCKSYPEHEAKISSNIPTSEQLKYKYLINIDGNSCCFSRLYWQIASGRVPVYLNSGKYEDLLLTQTSDNFLSYDMDEWLSINLNDIEQKHDIHALLKRNARFTECYLLDIKNVAQLYFQNLLHVIAKI